MHTYDADRHTWRYDVGGYAWDNSELSTDLWLWQSFLRTGDARTYRLAEAMTRHTGEVDVYHIGPWAGLGSRHNVQHWGCSCKQARIANPYYRRFLYYLAADDCIGDLLDEQVVTEQKLATIDRARDLGNRYGSRPFDRHRMDVDLGIDYGALLAAWLTEWERTGRAEPGRRITETLTDVARMPNRYFTGVAHFDPDTGHFDVSEEHEYISHLSAVFGIVEVLSEILGLVDVPEFEKAWLEYCRVYLGTPEEQQAAIGHTFDGSLKVAHSRLLAWAAHRTGDSQLADRAWQVFLHGPGDRANLNELPEAQPVDSAGVPERVHEIPVVTTNDAAQYGLAAIQNLALIGNRLPPGA